MVSLADVLDAQAQVESGGNPRARSPVGAMGLHQFMPATWRQYGQGKNPYDPVASRDAATRYLSDLYSKYHSLPLALAAYNGGAGGADYLRRNPQFIDHPDYKAPANTWRNQTAGYVHNILGMLNPISDANADETPYKQTASNDEWIDITDQFKPQQTQQSEVNNQNEWIDITDQFKPNNFVQEQTPEQALHALNSQNGTLERAKTEQPSFIDNAIGAGEAALTTATGMTGGLVGAVGGTVKSIADHLLAIGNIGKPEYDAILNDPNYAAKKVQEYSSALTYTPRTKEGQKQAEAVGDFATNVLVGLPMTGELGIISQSAKPSITQGIQSVSNAPARVAGAAKNISITDLINANPEKIAKLNEFEALKQQAENPNSLSAAGVDKGIQRQALAESFPVPFVGERGLTEGMLRRTPSQMAFESDIAKLPEGEALVKRMTNIEKGVYDNLNEFFDMTGAEASDLHQAGITVASTLDEMAGKAKKAVNAEYQKAAESPEGKTLVKLDNLVNYLNENAAYDDVAKILPSVRRHLVKNGFASVSEDGNLIANKKPLRDTEILRQSINANTGYDPTNQYHARNMKGLIDETVDTYGGDLYQTAREMHRGYAETFKNTPIIAKLLKTKNGTNERAVALEDVYNHAILGSSTDSLSALKKVLTGEGDKGQKAWNELQGRVIANIIDDTNRLTAPNAAGEAQVSVAGINKLISRLDKESKLDIIFEPKQAEMLRELGQITKDMLTAPRGVVNYSNTGRVVAQMLADAGLTTLATGIPVPIVSLARLAKQGIKNAQTNAKVKAALKPSIANLGETLDYQPMDLPSPNYEAFNPVEQFVTQKKPKKGLSGEFSQKLLLSPNDNGDIIKFKDGSQITRAERIIDLFKNGKTLEEAKTQAQQEFEMSNRIKKADRIPKKRVTITQLPGFNDNRPNVVFNANNSVFSSANEARAYASKHGLAGYEPRKFYDFHWALSKEGFNGEFNASTERDYLKGKF
jgi:hypothetical protein